VTIDRSSCWLGSDPESDPTPDDQVEDSTGVLRGDAGPVRDRLIHRLRAAETTLRGAVFLFRTDREVHRVADCPSRRPAVKHYQASSSLPSWKVPEGPSFPMVAIRTMTSAPFSTGCPAPLNGVRSVAVKPGSTALNLMSGSALAY